MKKYPHLEVRGSAIHHRGVFAACDIKKGVRVIEYTGKKLTLAQVARSKSDYLFQLNSKVHIDGKNTARYINHSCDPNCEVDISKGQIWIKTIRDIKKGDELVYSYSYDLEESKDYPCGCGVKKCVGYILAEHYWPTLKKLERQQVAKHEKNIKQQKVLASKK